MESERETEKRFTDRESGIYGGLMLSIRKYRDRLLVHHGYELNKKPREIDCLIIDRLDEEQPMDNAITAGFKKHNVVELKSPTEKLDINTLWKVVSYTTQYISDNGISAKDVTMTLIRAIRPNKTMEVLKGSGYSVEKSQPGVYRISGMIDIAIQIIVTKELEGDDFVPLRIQRKNADRSDYEKFANNVSLVYNKSEDEYVASIMKYGVYDDGAFDFKEDSNMYTKFRDMMEEAEAKGRAEGEADRKRLEERVKTLEEQLRKVKVAVL